ncbi:MAG: ribbon-helix-helix domain-containing protein, partial [Azonexus sp.]
MAKSGTFFPPAEPVPERPDLTPKVTKRSTRNLCGMFPPEVIKMFGVVAAEQDVDKRALLAEALNLL